MLTMTSPTTPTNFSLAALAERTGIRAFEGPLTAELVRDPGNYGLGQVPREKAPDATTTSICGFCSTGCSLNLHLRNGAAVNLTPDPEYPVNLGMACPKGWESLRVLDTERRATMR